MNAGTRTNVLRLLSFSDIPTLSSSRTGPSMASNRTPAYTLSHHFCIIHDHPRYERYASCHLCTTSLLISPRNSQLYPLLRILSPLLQLQIFILVYRCFTHNTTPHFNHVYFRFLFLFFFCHLHLGIGFSCPFYMTQSYLH